MPAYWFGAKLHELTGQEFSAFGVTEAEGGVSLPEIPAASDAAKAGLVAGDLIQGINGTKVKRVADLLEAYGKAGDAPLTLNVVRNQQTMELVVAGGAVRRVVRKPATLRCFDCKSVYLQSDFDLIRTESCLVRIQSS